MGCMPGSLWQETVAVGMAVTVAVTGHAPHRHVVAALPHKRDYTVGLPGTALYW